MELVSVRVKQKSADKPIVVAPISDIQWAGPKGSTAQDTLKRHIDRGTKLGALWLGLGDFVDFMSPSNRARYSAANLYDTATDEIDQLALDRVNELFEKFLKPTVGRWLGCVPLSTQALTRDGWKTPNQLKIGEAILAYDQKTQMCIWTPLRNIVRYSNEPLIRMESKSFCVRSTPDHRWFVRSSVHLDSNALGLKHWVPQVKCTYELKSHHAIKIAAEAEGGSLDLSPLEAAALGWIVTAGIVFWKEKCKQTQAFIYQSKPVFVRKLRKLLRDNVTKRYDNRLTTTIHEPSGSRLIWSILNKTNFTGPESLPKIATRLSKTARRAMLQAMLDAEGDGVSTFSQNRGPIFDTFCILATLEGYRLGRPALVGGKNYTVRLMKTRSHASVNDMVMVPVEPQDVWCPQTDYESWVMRDDHQITITGNCTEGHHFHTLKSGETSDTMISQLLKAPFLGTTGFIRLQLKKGNVDIFAAHGTGGGGKAASMLNKLESLAPYFDADIFIVGHSTKLSSAPINRITPVFPSKSDPYLRHRKVLLVNSGGFSRGYIPGAMQGRVKRGSYVESRLLGPSSLGAPFIYVTPTTRGEFNLSVEI